MKIDEIYEILKTFQVHPDKKLFEALLKTLNLIKDGKVSYKAVIDILSWKCEFPFLPKIVGNFQYEKYLKKQTNKQKII